MKTFCRFAIALLLVSFSATHVFAQFRIDIRALGAVGDSLTYNTTAIQKAIDSVSGRGGGEVLIDSGTYLSGTLVFKSNVTLRITPGTVLLAPSNDSAYTNHPYNVRTWMDTYTTQSFIFAEDVDSIRITGGGEIHFNGGDLSFLSMSVKSRPNGIRINGCTNVKIDSIKLVTAPQWMLHIMLSHNVRIHDVVLINWGFGSNDGMDIDCCTDVIVENCNVDTNDDPICVKTHSEAICRDVIVRKCTLATYERPVKVGNESLGPLVNIHFEDITVNASALGIGFMPFSAIYLSIADGGSADSIYFERIKINCPYQTGIFVRLCKRDNDYHQGAPPKPVQYLRNVVIRDVLVNSDSTIPCSITGLPGHPVENVLLQNIAMHVKGTGVLYNHPLAEDSTIRPESNLWIDSLPAYGMYVRHARNVTFDCYTVIADSADARPKYAMEDTAGIAITNEGCSPYNAINESQMLDDVNLYPNPSTYPSFTLSHLSSLCRLGCLMWLANWCTKV